MVSLLLLHSVMSCVIVMLCFMSQTIMYVNVCPLWKMVNNVYQFILGYCEEKKISQPTVLLNREGIIGKSAQIMACLDLVSRDSTSKAHVLITGETGTGKEIFARAVHNNSPRAENNFVVVDCGSLPETIM